DTLTLFVSGEDAPDATFTTNVMVSVSFFRRVPVPVHDTVAVEHDHVMSPVPDIVDAVRPDGSVSVTVTLAPVVFALLALTLIVYVPVLPRVKLPACDLVTVRSGVLGGASVNVYVTTWPFELVAHT